MANGQLLLLIGSNQNGLNAVMQSRSTEVAPVVEDLARREAACCGFLNIDAAHTERGVRLIMTSDNPDALPVIEMLVGGSEQRG